MGRFNPGQYLAMSRWLVFTLSKVSGIEIQAMHRLIKTGPALLLLLIPSVGNTGSLFVGYELGEMALNKFRHFAGEVGYQFDNNHALRIGLLNVALSERHLSSGEASAVEGDDVEGLWRGIDLYYDYPITDTIFVSPSVGYHDIIYTHRVLGSSVGSASGTAGIALSFTGDIVPGITALYWRFSLTFNYSFEEQEEAILGETLVSDGAFDFVPFIFVGYTFE